MDDRLPNSGDALAVAKRSTGNESFQRAASD